MAINTSTLTGISQRTNVYAEGKMLEHARPVMVLEKFGLAKQMPRNKSVKIKFRRPVPFAAQTTPLAEGVTPSSSLFTYEDVETTLQQYGQVAEVTDVIEDTHEDPVLNDIVMMLGENIGRTMEALNWGVIRGGSNVFYGNGSARADVNTPISLSKQRAIIRALKAQKAQKIATMLNSSPDFATRAVEHSFVAVGHTDLESDIRQLPGFIPCASYGTKSKLSEHEIGAVEDVRYVLSPDLAPFLAAGSATLNGMVSAAAANVDVYPVMYFGKESWAHVALRGQGAVSPSIIPVGQKTKDDPLGQRGVAGWKSWHAAVILNHLWLARLEVGVTDL